MRPPRRIKSTAAPVLDVSAQVLALCRQGDAALAAGDRAQARDCYRRSYALYQDQPQVRRNLVVLLLEAGEIAAAQALLVDFKTPAEPASQAINAWGVYELSQRRPGAAQHSFEQAIALFPDNVDAWNNLSNALVALQRHDEALAAIDHALQVQGEAADLHYNRGLILQEMGRQEAALAAYQACWRVKPDYALAYLNAANIHVSRREWPQAEYFAQQALLFAPDTPYLLGTWLFTRMFQAKWEGLFEHIADILRKIDAGDKCSILLPLLAMPATSAQQTHAARIYVEDRRPGHRPATWPPRRPGRVRIAYVSSDFCQHAVSLLSASLYELHDRQRFEVFLYSLRDSPEDGMQQRLRRVAEHFIDISACRDEQVWQIAREHDIDIAVDLNGHTVGERTSLFAGGLAPVQVNYLGYPGSMGSDYHDYIIADRWLIPPDRRQDYSEQVVYLPTTFQINDDARPRPLPMTRAELGVPEEALLLCSFNGAYKMNPVMFSIWMDILKACPQALLWLLADSMDVMQRLCAAAEAQGVDPHRLRFAYSLPYEQHLSRLALADIALDSLPFNGGTTSSDALWCGLPLVTCLGDTFAGRMAASLLHAAQLPMLVTDSLEAYRDCVITLAHEPDYRATIRQHLSQPHLREQLFGSRARTRELEAAYLAMHERRLAGLPAQPFAVLEQKDAADTVLP